MSLHRAAIVWLAVLCSVKTSAQDCHLALRGHVLEGAENIPLEYAGVHIKELGITTQTDEQGWFAIPDLCEATAYTIEIRHVECAHFTQIIQLVENTQMDFHLEHNNLLKEVIVKEKIIPPAATQSAQQVDVADLDASRGINLGETLKKLPGVALLSSGSSVAKPVIQGLHSNRIAIVSNGVALQSQQWGSDHAPEIDPFGSEKVEVLKGAAGVRYGTGAMAGVIVLEPAPFREEKGVGGWITTNFQSNGMGAALAGSADWKPREGGKGVFRLQGTLKRSGNMRAPDYWLGNTGVQELNFTASGQWKTERLTQQFSLTQFNQQLAILRAAHLGSLTELRAAIASDTPRNNINTFSYLIDRPRQQVQHTTAKYRAVWQMNERWKAVLQYSFQYNLRQEYDRGRGSITSGNKAQVSFQLWSNMLDFSVEHKPQHHWQGSAGIQGIQQLNFVSKGGYIPDYMSYGGGIWAMERYRRYGIPWEFEAGLRYDFRSTHATTSGNGVNDLDQTLVFGNVSGTTGVLYSLSPALLLKANTGLAWRPPHLNELFARGVHLGAGTYEEGNPELQAEKAWNTNLGIELKTNRLEGNISVFRNAVRDFIYLNQPPDSFVLTVRGSFPAYYYLQDNALLQGLDADVSWRIFRTLWAEGRFSTLYGQRHTQPNETSGKRLDWLPLMPADRLQYGLKWVFFTAPNGKKESFVRVLATHVAKQWRIPAEGLSKAAPTAFTTLGLEAAHTFAIGKNTLDLGLNVQNLGNLRYREYLDYFRYYVDAPGINVGLRAKITFKP